MPSQTMVILSKRLDPKTVLEAVIDKIVTAERCYPIDDTLRNHFNIANESWGRSWGESLGEIDEIKTMTEFLDPGFHVRFAYEESSRGCYMRTSRYVIFVPDNMVQLYERSIEDDIDADIQLEHEIEQFIKSRITSAKSDMAEAARKKQAEDEANNRAYEDTERAEYARLHTKYGSD